MLQGKSSERLSHHITNNPKLAILAPSSGQIWSTSGIVKVVLIALKMVSTQLSDPNSSLEAGVSCPKNFRQACFYQALMNLDKGDLPIREIKWVEESCTEACLHHRKWFGCGLSQPWRRVLVDCFVEVVVGVLWGHGGPNCLCQSLGLRVWWLGRLTLLAFRGFVCTAAGGG